ncbi:hypothetical protein SUDANB121_05469 [Nocardiopsis dassonvillei]
MNPARVSRRHGSAPRARPEPGERFPPGAALCGHRGGRSRAEAVPCRAPARFLPSGTGPIARTAGRARTARARCARGAPPAGTRSPSGRRAPNPPTPPASGAAPPWGPLSPAGRTACTPPGRGGPPRRRPAAAGPGGEAGPARRSAAVRDGGGRHKGHRPVREGALRGRSDGAPVRRIRALRAAGRSRVRDAGAALRRSPGVRPGPAHGNARGPAPGGRCRPRPPRRGLLGTRPPRRGPEAAARGGPPLPPRPGAACAPPRPPLPVPLRAGPRSASPRSPQEAAHPTRSGCGATAWSGPTGAARSPPRACRTRPSHRAGCARRWSTSAATHTSGPDGPRGRK